MKSTTLTPAIFAFLMTSVPALAEGNASPLGLEVGRATCADARAVHRRMEGNEERAPAGAPGTLRNAFVEHPSGPSKPFRLSTVASSPF